LEGSPGVGKTSLVVALGKFSGHRVVRINLSEQVSNSGFFFFFFLHLFTLSSISINHVLVQTDIMDLLGSDLPVESDDGIKFAWSDGILLQVKVSYFNGIVVSNLLYMY
jgi:midasin